MPLDAPQTFYDPDLSTPMAWLIVAALALAWFGSHWGGGLLKSLWWRPPMLLLRTALAWCSLWALLQTLARTIHFATPWSLPAIAGIGAAVIEIIAELYRADARTTGRKHLNRTLLGLRAFAVGVIITMLLEPVAKLMREREWDREVFVMIDDSDSMQLTDEQPDPSYAFDISDFRGRPVTGRTPIWEIWETVNHWEPLVFGEWAEENGLSLAREAISALPGTAEISSLRPLLDKTVTESPAELARHWRTARRQLRELAEREDQSLWSRLTETERAALIRGAQDRRADLAAAAVSGASRTGQGLLDELSEHYALRVFRFGKDVEPIDDWQTWDGNGAPSDEDESLRSRSDFTQALEFGLTTSSERTFAGMVFLSDGRHNADRSWIDAARVYGARNIPIGVVALGSRTGPRDGMITDVDATPRVHVEESVTLQADAMFAGMPGQEVVLHAYAGDKQFDSIMHTVSGHQERQTFSFAHTPTQAGEISYRVEIAPLENERILENNSGAATVIVDEPPPEPEEVPEEEELVEVLLVDGLPRWEFRYLKNLLDGRDRSVELQYVLTRPESIAGLPHFTGLPANAQRTFGQSLATSVPQNPADWLGFDVIILGDLPPDTFTDEAWEAIEKAVSEEGALLIVVAGQHAMPHRHTNPHFKKLLPIRVTIAPPAWKPSPFRLAWTPDGEESRLLEIGEDSQISRAVWQSVPPFTWRFPSGPAKRNAKVLAYAVPAYASEAAGLDPDTAVKHQPLIASQRLGAGRVVFFHFDSTWRLRYGADDRYHHRFWWQLLHWKVAPEEEEEPPSPEGVSIVFSSDRENYHLGERIYLKAKLTDSGHAPVRQARLRVQVIRDGKTVTTGMLRERSGSPGVYEAVIEDRLPEPGAYRFVLRGDTKFARLLRLTDQSKIEKVITVQPDAGRELQELTSDYASLQRLAELSGGRFVGLPHADTLAEIFGPPSLIDRRIEETTLWDNRILLIIFVSLLTLEWILRRQAGLV